MIVHARKSPPPKFLASILNAAVDADVIDNSEEVTNDQLDSEIKKIVSKLASNSAIKTHKVSQKIKFRSEGQERRHRGRMQKTLRALIQRLEARRSKGPKTTLGCELAMASALSPLVHVLWGCCYL